MSARSIMDPHPLVLHPGDHIRTAARYVMENRYRRLPVVDDEGYLVGVLDLDSMLARRALRSDEYLGGSETAPRFDKTL